VWRVLLLRLRWLHVGGRRGGKEGWERSVIGGGVRLGGVSNSVWGLSINI